MASTVPRPDIAETPTHDGPGEDSGLKRGLSRRHIMFIALGTAIGTGLFYGSASAIQTAGPAVILAYGIAGIAVFLVMRALGEMAVREPVAGSFAAYASRYLGPFAGYLTGWSFVFELAIVIIADVTAVATYMQFWYPGTPSWIWIAAVILFIGAINATHVGNFGELEFWLSLIKVVAVIGMIIGGVILIVMGVSYDDTTQVGVQNLVGHGGFMPQGAFGVLAALAIVLFSFGGVESIGVTAGEAENPERDIPSAINTVPFRILLFYIGTMVVIMSLVPWSEVSEDSSPFVQIFDTLGVPFAPHLLNFVVLTAAVSAINACTYSIGRFMYSMARDGQAPRVFGTVSKKGVPWASVLLVLAVMAVGAVVNILMEDAFVLVAKIATFAVVLTWLMIFLSHRSMRKLLRERGEEPGDFPMPGGVAGTWFGMAVIGLVIVMLGIDADSRPALIAGLVWVALLTIAWFAGVRKTAMLHDRTGQMPTVRPRQR